jgi:hypothetical protein
MPASLTPIVRKAVLSATDGDYEGTLADKVTVKAVVEGVVLEAERTVLDILRNPV